MRARPVLPVLALAAAVVLVAPPASAAPPQPACGDTLTVDTALRADLTCAAGPGLRLAAGVTLDLRGHTLRGPGDGVGVEVASAGAVGVRNGTVTGWGVGLRTYGVEGTGTGPLTVDRMRFRDNGDGLDVSATQLGEWAKPTTIMRSTITGSSDTAVEAAWSVPVTIDRTTLADNRFGLRADGGDTVVTGSRLLRHEQAISIYEGSVNVRDTSFDDNATGITAASVAVVTVADSRFTGSGTAVDGTWAFLDVAGSRFTANTTAVVIGGYGASVDGSTFRANGTGVTLGTPSATGSVTGNVFRLNGDGIRLEPGDAGIEVGGNDVRRSTGWGIYAPGVTDLGGNVARGNGNEPQCVGVVCDGTPQS
ncbi:right-handed parallel beta-helix repeat-containing protein [Cellulomonas sp. NPDC057328]|uniref:right-handed parallel beta-helix repeat-containing protein n=1 Tax=Cellulomonas sp. NPDC057328 TaxID=3346101 RepID=UPI00363ECDD0